MHPQLEHLLDLYRKLEESPNSEKDRSHRDFRNRLNEVAEEREIPFNELYAAVRILYHRELHSEERRRQKGV